MIATYINHSGTDLTVVNSAKVSFDTRVEKIGDKEIKLINYLATGMSTEDWDVLLAKLTCSIDKKEYRNVKKILREYKNSPKHFTPFTHCHLTMLETVPIFIARQRFKHQKGFTYNEVSRRYVTSNPIFFIPKSWRSAPKHNIKQGSSDIPVLANINWKINLLNRCSEWFYNYLLKVGVAPEQARMALPQSTYTSYYVTGNLYAWSNAYNQRVGTHAQKDFEDLTTTWDAILSVAYPESWKALTK